MAKYYNNFSSYVINAAPSGWTNRWYSSNHGFKVQAKTDGFGGKVLQHNFGGAARYGLLSWNAIDSDANRANLEVLLRVQGNNNTSPRYALVRCSGAEGAEYGYFAGLETGALKLYKSVNGTKTTIGTYSFTWSADAWYWIKLRANGTSIQTRVWADGSSEPDTWQISVTDSSVAGAGWIGVGGFGSSYTNNFDVVSVATNGDTADKPPTVTTNQATSVQVANASLQGTVIDAGSDNPTRSFEYGTTTAYGSTVSVGSGGSGSFSTDLTDLTPNTTYHFRAKAVNTTDTAYGTDSSFTTESCYKPSQLSPNNISISPLQSNTFTWQKDISAIQTHYELQYRSVGGNWVTTGAIASTLLQHTFLANTFTVDTQYEWQVKNWDSAHPDWYDWSTVTAFNTINPPTMIEITPAASSQVQLGVVTVSTRVTSIYGRNCRLNLLTADNAQFDNPKSYQTAFFTSGGVGTFTVGLSKRGINYIRLKAEDSTGLTRFIDYILNVIQSLYFITEPQVQIQGPQATHVTVRVRDSSPVVEYTAHIVPEPTANKWVERGPIEIDSGTVATCQTVAEQLVARWGREQKSVSGDINLTVTLSFKEKVHIIVPQAGIDEEMILQQKQHNVTGMVTTITCGDILLDDAELLARILDELGK